jgi:hypothetical protein
MRQDCVAQQEACDDGPVERWQWRELQRVPYGRKRQRNADRADDEAGCDQCRTGAALQEGDLRGADDVDDERLRQQGFDEPTGLEQRRVIPTVEDLRPDLRPPRSQMSRTSVLSSISGSSRRARSVSQLAERFVVEMPAGIVLAVSGEHNDALLRRGP